jgi:hypothetical protein
VSEAEFNRDAPFFLFLQPVGVYAGQRLDKRGLAVVNVSCRAHDDLLHFVFTLSCQKIVSEFLQLIENKVVF